MGEVFGFVCHTMLKHFPTLQCQARLYPLSDFSFELIPHRKGLHSRATGSKTARYGPKWPFLLFICPESEQRPLFSSVASLPTCLCFGSPPCYCTRLWGIRSWLAVMVSWGRWYISGPGGGAISMEALGHIQYVFSMHLSISVLFMERV